MQKNKVVSMEPAGDFPEYELQVSTPFSFEQTRGESLQRERIK